MSQTEYAVVHYAGEQFTIPAIHGVELRDIIEGLDLLGGSHLFRVGGAGEDDILRFWVTPGVPIVLQFPNGYEVPEDYEDYVVRYLQAGARHRLGLPLDGSGDNASARQGDAT